MKKPRCGARTLGEQCDRDVEYPEPAVYPLPESRRDEHRTEDGGWNRAYPTGCDETRRRATVILLVSIC